MTSPPCGWLPSAVIYVIPIEVMYKVGGGGEYTESISGQKNNNNNRCGSIELTHNCVAALILG